MENGSREGRCDEATITTDGRTVAGIFCVVRRMRYADLESESGYASPAVDLFIGKSATRPGNLGTHLVP